MIECELKPDEGSLIGDDAIVDEDMRKAADMDTDGDGCNVAQTFCVRLVERACVVWQREYKQLYEHCRGIVLDFV